MDSIRLNSGGVANGIASQQLIGHDWRYICTVLASKSFPPPHLPLVDTVVIEKGRPSIWLSTNSGSGAVEVRRVTDGDVREIHSSFVNISLGFLRNHAAQRCCVAHYSVGLPQVIDRATFSTHITVGFLVATCIQPYFQSQGCARLPTNLRFEYLSPTYPKPQSVDSRLSDPSVPHRPAFQYLESMSPPVPGEPSFRVVPYNLTSPPIPDDVVQRMERITMQLIFYLHRACPQERVMRLVTEFSLDDNGQLWLVYCPDIRTERNFSVVLPLPDGERHEHLPDGAHVVGTPIILTQVSLKDLVDLRNSPTPHPNLASIGSALIQCVMGGPMRPWAKAVNALRGTGCDEFILKMRAIEKTPQLINEELLDSLRSVVISDAFQPANLRRVGLLAETLGLWITAVTQASCEYYGSPSYAEFPLLMNMYAEAATASASRRALLSVGAIMASNKSPPVDLLEKATALILGGGGGAGGSPRTRNHSDADISITSQTIAAGKETLSKSLLSNPLAAPLTRHGKNGGKESPSSIVPISSSSNTQTITDTIPTIKPPLKKGGAFKIGPTPPIPTSQQNIPAPVVYPGSGLPGVTSAGSFILADGITKMTYAVFGTRSGVPQERTSLVILHDFFDSVESSAKLFDKISTLMRESDGVGPHALLLNFPGQAGSVFLDKNTNESSVTEEGVSTTSNVVGSLASRALEHNDGGLTRPTQQQAQEIALSGAALVEARGVPTSVIAGPLLAPRLALTSIVASGVDSVAPRWISTDIGSAAPSAQSTGSLDGIHTRNPGAEGVLIGPALDENGMFILPKRVETPNSLTIPNSRPHSSATSTPNVSSSSQSSSIGVQLPPSNPNILNNEFNASCLHQALLYLDAMRIFQSASANYLFDVVGIGYGASAALTWATRYGSQMVYRADPSMYVPRDVKGNSMQAPPRGLRAIVSVNGYAHIDAQLRTILTSTLTIFNTFPEQRKDLPAAFFSRFLFSDRYLSSVGGREQAVALQVAANSPSGTDLQTLRGRIKILQGAMASTDVRLYLASIVLPVPLIVVQSTDDAIVAPSNARGICASRGTFWTEIDADDHLLASPITLERPFLENATAMSGVGIGGILERTRNKSASRSSGESRGSTTPVPPEMVFVDNKLSSEAILRVAEAVLSDSTANTLLLRIRCGHEIRQERPNAFIDLIRVLTNTRAVAEVAAADFFTGGGGGGGQGGSDGQAGGGGGGGKSPRPPKPGGGGGGGGGEGGNKSPRSSSPRRVNFNTDSSFRDALALLPDRKQASSDHVLERPISMSSKRQLTLSDVDANAYSSLLPTPLDKDSTVKSLLFSHNDEPGPTDEEIEAAMKAAEEKRKAEENGRLEALANAEQKFILAQEKRRAKIEEENAAILKGIMIAAAAERDKREIDLKRQNDNQKVLRTRLENEERSFKNTWKDVKDEIKDFPSLPLGPLRSDNLEFATKMLRDSETSGGITTLTLLTGPDEEEFKRISEIPFDIIRKQREAEERSAEAYRLAAEYELRELEKVCAIKIQGMYRCHVARGFVHKMRLARLFDNAQNKAAIKLQRVIRYRRKHRAEIRLRKEQRQAWVLHNAAIDAQRIVRGFIARRTTEALRADIAALMFQCAWRGYRDRMITRLLRAARRGMEYYSHAATKIQSLWRMFIIREEYHELKLVSLAAKQVQRWIRGYKSRQEYLALRRIARMPPGADKVAAGFAHMATIKDVFSKSRGTLDKLNRALYKAENDLAAARNRIRANQEKITILDSKLVELDADGKEMSDLVGKDGAVAQKLKEMDYKLMIGQKEKLKQGGIAAAKREVEIARQAVVSASTVVRQRPSTQEKQKRGLQAGLMDAAAEIPILSKSEAARITGQNHRALTFVKSEAAEGDFSKGTGGRIDADFLKRMTIGLGETGVPRGLMSIIKGQDLTFGRSSSKAQAEIAAHLADLDSDIELSVRSSFARKGRFNAEIQSEKIKIEKEIVLDREAEKKILKLVEEIRASVARNKRGFQIVQDNVDALAADQRKQVELAKPPVPKPMPSQALVDELQRRVLAVQAISDENAKATSAFADRITKGYALALPSFIGSMAGVGTFKKLNYKAIEDQAGGETPARLLLGNVAPGAPLGVGMQTNTRVDFHHAAQRALKNQAEEELLALGGVDPIDSIAEDQSEVKTHITITSRQQGRTKSKKSVTIAGTATVKTSNSNTKTIASGTTATRTKKGKASRTYRDIMDRFDKLAVAQEKRRKAQLLLEATIDEAAEEEFNESGMSGSVRTFPVPRTSVRGPKSGLVIDSAVEPLGLQISGIGRPINVKTHKSAGVSSSLELIATVAMGSGLYDSAGKEAEEAEMAVQKHAEEMAKSHTQISSNLSSTLYSETARVRTREAQSRHAHKAREDQQLALSKPPEEAPDPTLGPAQAARLQWLKEARAAAKIRKFPRKLRDWGFADVARFITAIGLGMYASVFESTGVDGEFLIDLTPKELRATFGLHDRTHLASLIHAKEELRKADLRFDCNLAMPNLDPEAIEAVAGLQGASAAELAKGFKPPPVSTVFHQCSTGRAQLVEQALRSGVDANSLDRHGNTFLIVAARAGHKRIVDILLSRGVDINKANNQGNTALHFVLDPELKQRIDPDGFFGKYLKSRGGNDQLRNARNWKAVDGLGEPEGAELFLKKEEESRVEVPQQLAVPRVKRLPNLLARRKPKQQQQAAIESTPAESTGFLGLHLDASIVDIGSTAEADKEIERVTNSTSQPAAEGEGWKSPLSIFVG
jgi:hypothetical protein